MMGVFQEDLHYKNIKNIPRMINKIFQSDYELYKAIDDETYIKGCLQTFYYDANHNEKPLKTFDDRINFFRFYNEKKKEMSNSKIIEGYMRFIYSHLEHYIFPVMNVGFLIGKNYPNWDFGTNVLETIGLFMSKYYSFVYGFDVTDFNEDENKVLSSWLTDFQPYFFSVCHLEHPTIYQ